MFVCIRICTATFHTYMQDPDGPSEMSAWGGGIICCMMLEVSSKPVGITMPSNVHTGLMYIMFIPDSHAYEVHTGPRMHVMFTLDSGSLHWASPTGSSGACICRNGPMSDGTA